MDIIVSKDSDELARSFAEWLTADISRVLANKERYTLVLSGGSTPLKVFRLLRSPEFADRIEWKKIHFFWGDERFVPFDDERNNARAAFEELLNHVPVKTEQVHIMPTASDPEEAAAGYENILRKYFAPEGPSFDLVMLGMGDDGHTLSLFPGYPVIHENEKWVTAFYLDQQEMYRITLTAPIVNRSSAVAFLVAGKSKAHTLREVLEGPRNADRYPSQVISPATWFVDGDAASELNKQETQAT